MLFANSKKTLKNQSKLEKFSDCLLCLLCVNCRTILKRNEASSYINQKVYLFGKEITIWETGGVWYNSETREAKKVMRRTEKLYDNYGNDYL